MGVVPSGFLLQCSAPFQTSSGDGGDFLIHEYLERLLSTANLSQLAGEEDPRIGPSHV